MAAYISILSWLPASNGMPKKKKQTMRRISVYLTDEQCERLDQLSSESGVPQAEIIRRCLDAGLSNLKVGLK